MIRLGMVAGEASGDLLGADLLRGIAAREPSLEVSGIGGPGMQAAGLDSRYPMERLAVMGLTEVLGRLPELLRQRQRLLRHFLARSPDVFVGIDAPDYNLALERSLRRAGIPTVHYVSPSVWAWRRYRVKKIARAVDRMLCLFPFEVDFYHRHGITARFVGHPLARAIAMENDRDAARTALGLEGQGRWVALLPGSRRSEVAPLWPILLDTAEWLAARVPEVRYVAAAATPDLHGWMEEALASRDLRVTLVAGRSQQVMSAADVVCLASGTAALEAMLLRRPAVVTYRVSPITAAIVRRLQATRYLSLPNNLAGGELFPECMQENAVADKLGPEILGFLEDPARVARVNRKAAELHQALRGEAGAAAAAVLELAGHASS